MKRISLIVALVIACITLGIGVRKHLHAQELAPPAKMQALDAAKLDAALAHLRELQQAAQPYQETVAALCSAYKIDPAQLGRSVSVNFQTGEIQRAPAAPGK